MIPVSSNTLAILDRGTCFTLESHDSTHYVYNISKATLNTQT